MIISAQIESDLVDLALRAADFLKEMGVEESGVGSMIRQTYHLLGLQTFFTAGEKEVRAWTIQRGDTAPQATGVIHTDFERGLSRPKRSPTKTWSAVGQCRSQGKRSLPHGR